MRTKFLFAIFLISYASGCANPRQAVQTPEPSVAMPEGPVEAPYNSFLFRASGIPIAVESLSRKPGSQTGTIEINEALRVTYELLLREDQSVSSFKWKADRPDRPPAELNTVQLEAAVTGATMGPAGAVIPYFDQSAGLLGQLVRHARHLGGDKVEVRVHRLIDARVLPATISFPVPGQAVVEVASKIWHLSLDPNDDVIAAHLSSYGVTVELLQGRTSGLRPIWLPQGVPAGASYEAHEVRFGGADGVTIAGTLTLPRDMNGPAPAAIMITGSGRNNRNQGSPPSMPFREIADALSSRGIAVLRVDDRGVGESSGDAHSATTLDEARDIEAALSFLRSHGQIDRSRIALIGWSEGGLIAPIIASSDPHIAAVALLNGGFNGREIAEYQVRYAVENNPAVAPERREQVIAGMLEGAQKHPRSATILSLDGTEAVQRLRMPVLLINGQNDRHVPPSQALRFASALRQAGNNDVTTVLFPNLNHVLLPDPDGRTEGFPFLPSPRLPKELLAILADWVDARLQYRPLP